MRSASRSSTDSIPTDSRTSVDGTSSGEPVTDACVISRGCSISDSTPPSDSASRKTSVRSHTRSAAASPPCRVKETIPPKPRICLAATSCPGWSGRPG